MGYLQLTTLPNFSKMVLALSFMVPQESVDAAIAAGDAAEPSFSPILPYTIPLVTAGQQQELTTYTGSSVDIAIWERDPSPPETPKHPVMANPTLSVLQTDPVSPFFIGLDCSSGSMKLVISIQTSTFASVTGDPGRLVEEHIWGAGATPAGYDASAGTGWRGGFDEAGNAGYFKFVFSATEYPEQPELFLVQSPTTLAADAPHHIIVWFDLSQPCTTHSSPTLDTPYDTINEGTDSYCRLGYAIDDVNKDGEENLNPYFVTGSSDPNAILTETTYDVATDWHRLSSYYNTYFGDTECSFTPGDIPTAEVPFGVPASAAFVAHVYPVHMAELVIFTDVTLDTGIESNRRIFIKADGTPELDHSLAEALFGKVAEIRLSGSSFWKTGVNKGSVGNFTKTGTVNTSSFVPDITP